MDWHRTGDKPIPETMLTKCKKMNVLLFWRDFRRWLHWRLPFWQYPVQPAAEAASEQTRFRSVINLWAFDEFAHIDNWIVYTWVRSRNCGCLVTWFCYQLIAKPGNKTATVSWPDPHILSSCCDTTDWFILTWFYSISLYFILNITLINIILTVSFTLSLP